MGIYVCEKCFLKYGLEGGLFACRAACEICGPIHGDWEPGIVMWTTFIDRQIPEDKPYLLRRLKELSDDKIKKTL